MKIDWQTLLKNGKTTLFGLLAFALAVPGVYTALEAWANHQPVNWRSVLVSLAVAASGVGNMLAKDASTHSTVEEISEATLKKDLAEGKNVAEPENQKA